MAVDPTQDADFMAAAPSDQMHYLMSTDPDFAKASPPDQLSYLAHIRGAGPVQGPQIPRPNPSPTALTTARPDYVPATGDMNPDSQGTAGQQVADTAKWLGAGALSAGAALAAPAAISAGVPALARLAAQHPIMTQMAASMGIGAARNIPVVGKYIPSQAELMPFLMGRAGESPSEPEAQGAALKQIPQTRALPASQTGEALATTPPTVEPNYTPVKVGTTPAAGQRPDGPYSGPRTPVMESVQSGQISKVGYHPESQTAVVEFNNGKVYEYRGVPEEMYQNLKNAPSTGSYFAQNLKGRYTTNFRGAVKPTAGATARRALSSQ